MAGSVVDLLKKGDLIWVTLPKQEGSVQSGSRPCICMGNAQGLKNSNVVTVIPLSSKLKATYLPVHVLLPKNPLPMPSIAMAEQITTVPKDSVKGFIGTLGHELLGKVEKAVLIQLGIGAN